MRVALITGAGSGIGRAVAHQLLADGWTVVLTGRRGQALEQTLASAPTGAVATSATATAVEHSSVVAADLTTEQGIEAVFAHIKDRYGRLDLLFNNAGSFGPTARIDEYPVAEFDAVLDVNIKAAFRCAQEAFALMSAQEPAGGRIINNGSISAQIPRPHSVGYAVSKHAMTGLTKAIELDGRPLGITATQIDIGNAATELLADTGSTTGALQADGRKVVEPMFDVAHAAKLIAAVANADASVTINHLTVTAQGMPYAGRG
ncbi:SDR family oxidoreductase [Micrococcoides hystricis]|uniref:SDR family oxidoreductase n=1 Tax=Micrococcoides hystricis TaxID=1572761 RepID=A0ABV6PCN7_9MICC